jgi:hypothetical protein
MLVLQAKLKYLYRGPNGMGQVPLARHFNKESTEVRTRPIGSIFIFLSNLQVHRSIEKD